MVIEGNGIFMKRWFIFFIMLALMPVSCLRDGGVFSAPSDVATAPLEEPAGPATIAEPTPPGEKPASNSREGRKSGEATGRGELEVEMKVEPFSEPAFAPPAERFPRLARIPADPEQRAVADRLEVELPPDRDEVLLAIAYRGVTEIPDRMPPLVTEPLPVGTKQQLIINNTDSNINTEVTAILKAVGEHAYFWFDTTSGNREPSREELERMATAFDEIYEEVIFYFGRENSPGIDGDPRIHIVNASPLTICDVGESNVYACPLLGYFSSRDLVPAAVDPRSNEREMFVMNGTFFGTETYLYILAHEFRHMIEANYDINDIDWEVEGSAMLAEDLLGFSGGPLNRANAFLGNPDQQLNQWPDGNPQPYYGQGYLFNRYIYDRLGTDLYRVFATHPLPGMQAITAVALAAGLDFDGMDLWLDWLVAQAIHDQENIPEIYRLPEGLRTAQSEGITRLPTEIKTTVGQYAADYYKLFSQDPVTVSFTGSTLVPLLNVQPRSGRWMWVANRANNSHARLTRSFDLSHVEQATLHYSVYRDIERSYDFGYASLSLDGGVTWRSLDAAGMDGMDPADNSGDGALTDRFYTGRGSDWIEETVDLSPYTGQEIQIRFEFVTDPILTFDGLAIDNLAIPEIGYLDDVEEEREWTAEGFVRATGFLPQTWHLQLITFEGDRPRVTPIELADDQTAVFEVDPSAGFDPPILIISASAPMTLNRAHYQLSITDES